jgi:signal transduction histidine kinase
MKPPPAALFEVARDETLSTSPDAVFEWIAGVTPPGTGRPVSDLCLEAPDLLAAVRRALGGQAVSETFQTDCEGDEPVLLHTHLLPVRGESGEVVRVVGLALDVSEAHRMTRDLERMGDRLRRLALKSQEDHQADRERIARGIHDALGQELTAIRFDVQAVARRVSAGETDRALAQLATADASVDRAVAAVQRVAAGLRPPSLAKMELSEALREETQRFGERTGIETSFTFSVPSEAVDRLPPALKTAVFRVVQEALTNVARHAGADGVDVRLACRSGPPTTLVVDVSDDGSGPPPAFDDDALGVLGMRERTAEWGGSLMVGPVGKAGARGTHVQATFEVPPVAAPADSPRTSPLSPNPTAP